MAINTADTWVHLYVRAHDLVPVRIGEDSLNALVAYSTDLGRCPSRIIGWSTSFEMTLAEMTKAISGISSDDRAGIERIIKKIRAMAPAGMKAHETPKSLLYFEIDFRSVGDNAADGAIVHVKQLHRYVSDGMIMRSYLPALKRETGLDLSNPGSLTLGTIRKKVGWLLGDGCPALYDDNDNEISSELKRVASVVHYKGKPSTRVDWF